MGYEVYVDFLVDIPIEKNDAIYKDLADNLFGSDGYDCSIESDIGFVSGNITLRNKTPEEVMEYFKLFSDKWNITFKVTYRDDFEDSVTFFVGQEKRLKELQDLWISLINIMLKLAEGEDEAMRAYHGIESDPTKFGLNAEKFKEFVEMTEFEQ